MQGGMCGALPATGVPPHASYVSSSMAAKAPQCAVLLSSSKAPTPRTQACRLCLHACMPA